MFKTDNHASLRIHCSVFELKQQYSNLEPNPIDTDTALCDKITKICRAGGNNIDTFIFFHTHSQTPGCNEEFSNLARELSLPASTVAKLSYLTKEYT